MREIATAPDICRLSRPKRFTGPLDHPASHNSAVPSRTSANCAIAHSPRAAAPTIPATSAPDLPMPHTPASPPSSRCSSRRRTRSCRTCHDSCATCIGDTPSSSTAAGTPAPSGRGRTCDRCRHSPAVPEAVAARCPSSPWAAAPPTSPDSRSPSENPAPRGARHATCHCPDWNIGASAGACRRRRHLIVQLLLGG